MLSRVNVTISQLYSDVNVMVALMRMTKMAECVEDVANIVVLLQWPCFSYRNLILIPPPLFWTQLGHPSYEAKGGTQ